jgi:hypothetical protein
MRLLTDNPSMDYLRREAKDVLQALRALDNSATLADAQHAIANEYGFRTWADLKAEVDRRRADVPQPPEGLDQEAADAFGLGAVRQPMTPIRYEYMGRRWSLETERGRFMLSPVFDWISDTTAEVAVDLQERARAAGVRSPRPVRAPDGGLVRRVQDQSWRIYEWLDLGPNPVEPITPSVATAAGSVLAAIHEVAPPTELPIQGAWVSPDDRPTEEHWTQLLDAARRAGCEWAPDLAGLAPTIAELSTITAVPDQADVVITNRDVVLDTVRLGPSGELVVLHWDFAGPMLPEWELATTLTHWTQTGANVEAAKGMLAGYRERRGATLKLSAGSFSPFVTGWLTWLLHRGWEATAATPSEQRDFAQRTVREVLADPLTVAKIERMIGITQ